MRATQPDGRKSMESQTGDDSPLQFDSVSDEAGRADAAVSCAACSERMADEYFDVNGQSVCTRCHATLAEHAEIPRGWAPLGRALIFGVAAAVLGAILYFAVVAITHLEIGIVAIAIGYMVGYAIRMATRGRGGRRFQIIAVLFTYWAVGLAYVPFALGQMAERSQRKAAQQSAARPLDARSADVRSESGRARMLRAVALLVGFSFALPMLVVIGSLPGGLISGAIIAFGMQQAWRMTGAPELTISGPYRVGTAPPALP